jgi:hypothetical protein
MGQISKCSAGSSYSLTGVVTKTQISYNDFDSFEGRYFREGRSIQKVVLAVMCPLCLFV